MTLFRPKLLLFVVGCLCGAMAGAQESTGGTGGTGSSAGGAGSGTGAGASSAFGTPSTPGTTQPSGQAPSTTTTRGGPTFRTGTGTTGTANERTGTTGGAASNFGTEQTDDAARTRSAPTSFSVPGFYGRGPQQFTVGEGRLARPRFRVTASVSVGYDDNVFQTPTHAKGTPDQKVQVLVKPGVPESTVMTGIDPDTGLPTTEAVPGQEAEFRTEVIPGTPAPERIGSFITREDVSFDVQFASRRSLFTFDLEVGNSYYWNRPGKKAEYTGRVALVYLRKLTGRMQFTASVDASYQSQPDFSQVNAPTSNDRGSYLYANAKADLSYRLTPRFSSVTSIGYNTTFSVEDDQQSGNYGETTFGTELRYLFSPRFTLLGELRYSSSLHDNEAQDTTTYFVLAGGELTLTRRFVATLRLGEALQTFSESGEKESAPYVEATLAYRLARGTTIQWNGRYGYEESGGPGSRLLVARTGLSLTQIFTPHLQATLSLNLVRSTTTTTSEVVVPSSTGGQTATAASTATATPATTDPATASTDGQTSAPAEPAEPEVPETKTVVTERIQDTIDASIAFHYALSRRWSLNLNYSYTMVIGPEETSDYYRQRIFFGAQYLF